MTEKLSSANQQLQETFVAEAREQIQRIVDNLIKIETTEDESKKAKWVELAFRDLHNLKGSARAVEFISVELVCHPLEDIMAALKRKQISFSAELLDLVISTICLVEQFLEQDPDSSRKEAVDARNKIVSFMQSINLNISSSSDDNGSDNSDLTINSVQIMAADATESKKPVNVSQENAETKKADLERTETLRIPATKLDLFMQKAEEMLSVKAMSRQQRISSQSLQAKFEGILKTWNKASLDLKVGRQVMERMRSQCTSPQEQIVLRKMIDLLDWNGECLKDLNEEVKSISKAAYDYSHITTTTVDVLLDETKRLLMMPCSSVFEGFPLVVRQLARELGKEVDLKIVGADVELDKRILSQLKDPLIHLLRNSVDHGMESPAQRQEVQKSGRGLIEILVSQVDGNLVEMRITDDGRGINIDSVKQSAIRLGIMSADDASKLSRDESLALVFSSQLSTSRIITEISGRGIGLAVVDENIRKLGGRIKIETEIGKGTAFIISLPVTIATFRGVLVDVLNKTFVVPTTSIDRVVRIKHDAIKPVEGNNTMLLGDHLIPVCHMESVLELPGAGNNSDVLPDKMLTVAVLGSGDNRIGFVVDEVLEEQEVLVKSLGPVFSKVRNVSGVTVLGSGKVVPILNSTDMLKWSRRQKYTRAKKQSQVGKHNVHSKTRPSNSNKKILVVDDTLTSRMLLRNIFESAGFAIKTANDGAEALKLLRSEPFDLVITDIEMPVMNGFELTEQIRQESSTSEIPVVMVTSMTSREDRERGVAVGANAYFVKSSFDQSNLLDVVGTLV